MNDAVVKTELQDKVIVEVAGGLVSAVWAPEGIAVVVVDHDNLEDAGTPDEDVAAVVAATPELPWGSEGYGYRDQMHT